MSLLKVKAVTNHQGLSDTSYISARKHYRSARAKVKGGEGDRRLYARLESKEIEAFAESMLKRTGFPLFTGMTF